MTKHNRFNPYRKYPNSQLKRIEAHQNFLEAWQAEHRPWFPPQCFVYCKVFGPKQFKGIGSSASIKLQLFLVSLREYREFCHSTPLSCTIEILSKKPVTLISGQKCFSIEAQITRFQDNAFFLKFPKRNLTDYNQSYIAHIPDQLYCKFHMFYDPKSSIDGTYRGIIDYWLENQTVTAEYTPPKYHHNNVLSTIQDNQEYRVSYEVKTPYSELSQATELHTTLPLLIRRTVRDYQGRPLTKFDHIFLLNVEPQRCSVDQLTPQVEECFPIEAPDDYLDTDSEYLTGPKGSKFPRQAYEDFINHFDVISYSLSEDTPMTHLHQSFHFSGIVKNTPPSSDFVLHSCLNSLAKYGQTQFTESELFATGNLIHLNGLRWMPGKFTEESSNPQSTELRSSPPCNINYIAGRKLPEIGIFPSCPPLS